MEPTIRLATPDDHKAICALLRQLDEEHIPMRPSLLQPYEGEERSRDEVRAAVESPDRDYLVAEVDGAVVGMAFLEDKPLPDLPIFRLRRVAMVLELVVDRGYRSLGIGKALMDEAKRWAAARDLTCIQLNVQAVNSDAIRFYEREGFEPFYLCMWHNAADVPARDTRAATLPQLRMEKTDLDNVPDVPVPEGYRLRTYEPGDETGLARVYAACDLGCTEPQAVRQRLVEREFFRPERLFVVERAGAIVGTVLAWEECGEPPAGYLHMLAVLPEERDKGLGALLAVAAIRRNRREGFRVQRLDTDDFRLPAIRLYLRLGFRPVLTHATHGARWNAVARALNRPDLLETARREM